MSILSVVDTVAGKLSLITEKNEPMQLLIDIESVTKFQSLLGVNDLQVLLLNALYVLWIRAFFL
jgi:hypothetical protein